MNNILKKRIEFFIVVLIIGSLFSFPLIQALTTTINNDDAGTPTEESNDVTEVENPNDIPEETGLTFTEATEDEPSTLDTTNQQDIYVQIDDTQPDVQVNTIDGSIADFNMINSLFYLGSLIQGSFISFENNNNIFFSSLFDSSKFTATMDEEGELNVGQRNGNGDLGRVYITINKGNLTQDEYVVFIPEGNEPIYIYYNTTEIEFKDGNVSLLGEIVTNNDNTKEKTSVDFNENGFTKIELPIKNTYTIGDFSIINNGRENLIICKKDPLCDVNIDENVFTIKGKIQFLVNNKVLMESLDENNVIELNFAEETMILSNLNPKEEILVITRIGYHEIIETKDTIYSKILNEEYPYLFTTYDSDKIIPELIIENKVLKFEDLARIFSLPNMEEMEKNCINYAYKKIIGETNGATPEYCA